MKKRIRRKIKRKKKGYTSERDLALFRLVIFVFPNDNKYVNFEKVLFIVMNDLS